MSNEKIFIIISVYIFNIYNIYYLETVLYLIKNQTYQNSNIINFII